jgi:glycosyltransferase involved in cell wall biosynthesis
MTKHVAIFEPEAGGHQMEYLRHVLVEALDRADLRFTLVTSAHAARHVNCVRLARDLERAVTVHVVPDVSSRHAGFRLAGAFAEQQWRHARMAQIGIGQLGWRAVDFVFVPHLESIGLLQLGLRPTPFNGLPWATIAVGARFHHRHCGIPGPFRLIDPVQRLFFKRVVQDATLTGFGTIDPYLAAAVGHPKVIYCPEPRSRTTTTDSAQARREYGVPADAFVVVVFGVIDRRKCLDVLIDGAARVASEIDLVILLAGPQDAREIGPILSGPNARLLRDGGRLVEVNRFILADRDPDPIAAADVAWVFYERNFVYSSSVLVHAGSMGCPVVVRRQGVVGYQVEEHGIGVALSSEAPERVADALRTLARDSALRRRMAEAGRRTFQGHTPKAFAEGIVTGMLSALEGRVG